jgi:hypothetical protein
MAADKINAAFATVTAGPASPEALFQRDANDVTRVSATRPTASDGPLLIA